MKKVLVLSSSLRKGSNSETLAQEFAKGAAEAGNKVEFESLRGKKIRRWNRLMSSCSPHPFTITR